MPFKKSAAIFLLFACLHVSAQKIQRLKYTDAGDLLKPDDAIIYSAFTPPNFNMGTGVAEIGLYNTNTKSYYQLHAVGQNSLRSKNIVFCFHISPGTYQLVYLVWTDFHGLYYKQHSGLISKNRSYTNSAANNVIPVLKGLVPDTVNRYKFTVKGGTLYYLGNWDFEKGAVKFTDTRTETDQRIKKDYLLLNFNKAVTELPE
jgi:hypothetical protein